jgi:integrase
MTYGIFESRHVKDGMWVVHTRLGYPYSSSGFKALWKRARQSAGLREPYTFHDIKAKSISDYEGDKRRFSGHATERMVARYDRRVPEVLAHERKYPEIS